jgi:hypothetical protein
VNAAEGSGLGEPCYGAGVPTWLCLLRGVNLGRQRKLPMAALRDSLTAAGLTGVRTYLQSGNIIAESGLRTRAQVSHLVRAVPGGIPAQRRDALLAVASHCTVHNTLRREPAVSFELDS